MDQRTWLWRKRSMEKTIVANGEDVQPAPVEKEVELENSLRTLNEKLASVPDECSGKDELVQNYEKMAEDAIAEKHKAEEEAWGLKQELDEALKQKLAANERLSKLNAALKDCMEQLNLVLKDQEQLIHNAVIQTSKDFEKAQKKLEEKLSEKSKGLTSLTYENSYLSKALLGKEQLIEDLNNSKCQTEAEFEALMSRLDTIEKENTFLRYEYRTLEREFDLKNEEVNYGRRSADENKKKIKKLEAECQRLRGLTRNRLPGLGIHQSDNTNKKLGFLVDQVRDLEEENKILKECLAKKEEEMEIFYHENVRKFDLAVSNLASDELSYGSGYGIVDSYEKFVKSESKIDGSLDMSLMDDFVEMEKLAIIAVDASPREKHTAPISKALIPLGTDELGHELETKNSSLGNIHDWIEDVRNLILEQHNISKRSLDELLGDIRMALHATMHPEPSNLLTISGNSNWKSPTSSPRSNLVNNATCSLEKSLHNIIELVGRFDSQCERSLKVADSKVHVFRWKNCEITNVLQEFVSSCNNLLDGKLNLEEFIGHLSYILGLIIGNCVSNQDYSTVRDEFKKHLGGDGPGTALELESVQKLMFEMEKIYSVFQVEIEGLKNELEVSNESKRTTEDQFENLKMINEELDTQLFVTKSKLNEALRKLSSTEVELDNKSQCCEELEGTCLDLQLQLESVTSNRFLDNENQEELQTGSEITKASLKLLECEGTILKLGNQLKALGSAKELSVVDKVLAITNPNNKKFRPPRLSLRDQMFSEDNPEGEHLSSPKTKETISTTEAIATPEACLGMKKELKNNKALVIIPSKRRGRGGGVFGFLRKLLLRRKKTSNKNALLW